MARWTFPLVPDLMDAEEGLETCSGPVKISATLGAESLPLVCGDRTGKQHEDRNDQQECWAYDEQHDRWNVRVNSRVPLSRKQLNSD